MRLLRRLRAGLMVGAFLLGAPVPGAESPFSPGQVVEKIPCEGDPALSYALYLPSTYDPQRSWPILFVLDPRGRAMIGLELFREGAEQNGYILVSSYNSRSDGAPGLNHKAMNAMLPDVQKRFSVNTGRVYLAGFSGTARVSWDFGVLLKGHVQGVIGAGAGLPPGFELAEDPGFVFFGATGLIDFNYEEVRRLDERLDSIDMRHHIEFFEGPHSWMPKGIATEAVEWMELAAMRSGLRSKDEAWIGSLYARRLERAESLEKEGRLLDTYERYAAIAADFDGLYDVAAARAKVAELHKDKSVRRALVQMDKNGERQKIYERELGEFLARYQTADPLPSLEQSLMDLRIKSLKKQVGSDDPLEVLAARRVLENIFVYAGFYQPEAFFAAGAPLRALGILQIAGAIKPESPQICWGTARAHGLLGQAAEAIHSLECVEAAGWLSAGALKKETAFDSLREKEEFKKMVQRLEASGPSR